MKKVYYYMGVWLLSLALAFFSFRCNAQSDTVKWTPYYPREAPMKMIWNPEYVTVKTLFWRHRLHHVKYLVVRKGYFYFPDLSPVEVYNYKVKGIPEVIIKP
jgi:hypothetical protein